MWKPTQQEALWFHGGNLHQSRHYSLYLALQLKARQAASPRRSTACRRCTTSAERARRTAGTFFRGQAHRTTLE